MLLLQIRIVLPPNKNTILFEQEESWGPCPEGPEGLEGSEWSCHYELKIYYSGKIVLGSGKKEKQLSEEEVKDIIKEIKSSHIIRKPCFARGIVLDFSKTEKIQIGIFKKTIIYPACEKEMERIEDFLKFYLDD